MSEVQSAVQSVTPVRRQGRPPVTLPDGRTLKEARQQAKQALLDAKVSLRDAKAVFKEASKQSANNAGAITALERRIAQDTIMLDEVKTRIADNKHDLAETKKQTKAVLKAEADAAKAVEAAEKAAAKAQADFEAI